MKGSIQASSHSPHLKATYARQSSVTACGLSAHDKNTDTGFKIIRFGRRP